MNSDLMIEAVNISSDGYIKNIKRRKGIKIITLCNGNDKYITIEFDDIFNVNLKKYIVDVIDELMGNNENILVVGLGNEKSTFDSLGPLVIDNIVVSLKKIYAIKPGVSGATGIETNDIIKGIVDKIKPDCVLVIDSLKSNSLIRLNNTIQFTNTGIHPGSGIKNKREEISKKTLGIPVIAVGVPTISVLNNDMIITSKDIDFVIEKLSDILSISINEYLYKNVEI